MKALIRMTVAAAILSGAASPNRAPAQTAAKIDRLVTQYHRYGQFNGAVLVAERGRILYQKGFGLANLELGTPITTATKFRVASITKSFTAILVMQLVEAGKIALEGTVSDYLPDYPKATGTKITVRQLLTHTAGLGDIGDFPRRGNDFPAIVAKMNAEYVDLDEMVAMIAGAELRFEPGTSYRYSNDGYILLGALIARVTGQPYDSALERRILRPLGMTNSGMAHRAPLIGRRASGYDRVVTGYENATPIGAGPAGGMYSTVEDLFRFSQALSTDRLLSQASKDIIFARSPNNVAYGWKVRQIPNGRTGKPETVLITDGSIPGFTSLMVRSDSGRRLIVQLTNTREPTFWISDINQAVTKILDGQPYAAPKRSVADSLVGTIERRGLAAALRQYQDLRRSSEYYVDEARINSIGYHLLGRKQVAEAVAVFELNVEAYPKSSNAYDSLGEAYLVHGDTTGAITNYRRSLELNPANGNAAAVLKRLGAGEQPPTNR